MATALTSAYTRFTDKCNRVLAGGVVRTYEPNSLAPKVSYQDPEGTIPNLPEVVLDETGRARIFLLGDYRIQVYSNDGILIEDNLYVDQNVTQSDFQEVNKSLVATVNSINDLNTIEKWDGRTVAVSGIGNYKYSSSTDTWSRDFITDRQVITVDSVADLSSLAKWDGRTVHEKECDTNLVYDSAKAAINNGVTVFNGWVRQIKNDTLLAKFAGIYNGLSIPIFTQKIQSLFDASSNGYLIDLENVNAFINTHIYIQDKDDLQVVNASIKGDRDTFVFNSTFRGMLRARNCKRIKVSKSTIKGVKKTNPNVAMATSLGASGRFQDGDAGIELLYCDGYEIYECDVSYVKTWGIMSIDGSDGSIHDNKVYDCVRQSGISAFLGNTIDLNNSKVYNNTVYNCGLYGIEIEKYNGNVKKPYVFNNTISDCQSGIMAVNNIRSGNIHDNQINDCHYGLSCVSVNTGAEADANFFKNNKVYNCRWALAPSDSNYFVFTGNYVNGLITNDYIIHSPYDTVEKIIDANNFYCVDTIAVGTQIKINNAIYTVSASVAVTDTAIVNEIGITPVYKITVNNSLSGVADMTQFRRKLITTYGYNAFFKPNTGIKVIDNTFDSCANAVNQAAVQSTNNSNIVANNKYVKCTSVYTGNATGYTSKGSTFESCTNVISLQKANSGNNALRRIEKVSNGAVQSAVSTKPSQKFYIYDETHICRFRVIATNVTWTTADAAISLVVRINGTQVGGSVSVSAKNSNVDTLLTFASVLLLNGENTVQIIDTTGSFGCDSWSVEIFCVA